jgi:hypothetical protein
MIKHYLVLEDEDYLEAAGKSDDEISHANDHAIGEDETV